MNYYKPKMEVVTQLKRFLEQKGFLEVITPVIRRETGELIERIKLDKGVGYLRDSHELQLRWLLSDYDSVYEIGSCFRDEASQRSSTEFLLMELFTSKYDLDFIKKIVEEFILSYKPDTVFEDISIAEIISDKFGVDLSVSGSQDKLYTKLKKLYGAARFKYDYEYVQHYIETEIEPLSKGRVVFFTDYPECTCSYANIKCADIIKRFELFANELELANGFDDECNAVRFMARNKDIPIFPTEEAEIMRALQEKILPAASAGVGIGIERLCMFLFGVNDIDAFSFPSKSF